MRDVPELLALAKQVVVDAVNNFLSRDRCYLGGVTKTELGGREVKLVADTELESLLLDGLKPTGLPILSEESGQIGSDIDSPLKWIVDPLDGSINYLRSVGPSAISIALWDQRKPIFGVIFRLDNKKLSWGGKDFGAWTDDVAIRVSGPCSMSGSILCSGFPARFDVEDVDSASEYFIRMREFSKVRMIGSAACSLELVANGSADAYFEDRIMLWDVAAGIALVEGAGGNASVLFHQDDAFCCNVFASGILPIKL